MVTFFAVLAGALVAGLTWSRIGLQVQAGLRRSTNGGSMVRSVIAGVIAYLIVQAVFGN